MDESLRIVDVNDAYCRLLGYSREELIGKTPLDLASDAGAAAFLELIAGADVLLVDDIMTTGETVRECCRILAQGGTEDIQVAVVGRA